MVCAPISLLPQLKAVENVEAALDRAEELAGSKFLQDMKKADAGPARLVAQGRPRLRRAEGLVQRVEQDEHPVVGADLGLDGVDDRRVGAAAVEEPEVGHLDPEVAQQGQEPIVLPAVGPARTQLIVDVDQERVT